MEAEAAPCQMRGLLRIAERPELDAEIGILPARLAVWLSLLRHAEPTVN